MPQREDGQYRKQENYIFLFRLSPSKATCGFLFYTSVVFYCFLQLHPVSLSSKTLILVLLHPYLNPKSSLCTTPLSLFSLCTSLLLISSFVFVYHTLICHLSPVFSFLSPPLPPFYMLSPTDCDFHRHTCWLVTVCFSANSSKPKQFQGNFIQNANFYKAIPVLTKTFSL